MTKTGKNVSVIYAYPIKPGTEEWVEFNHGELVQMLQIPDDILKELSTEELVDIVLNYPYFSDFYFYDTYQKGFETMSLHFNGLIELMKRDDVGSCLLSLIKESNLIDNYNKEKDFNLISRIAIILAQEDVVEKLDPSETLALYDIMEVNSNLKARVEDDFNLFTHVFLDSIKQQDIQPFMGITYEYTPNGSALLCYIYPLK